MARVPVDGGISLARRSGLAAGIFLPVGLRLVGGSSWTILVTVGHTYKCPGGILRLDE